MALQGGSDVWTLSGAYSKLPLLVPGSIHDLPRPACVAIAEVCGIAPGAPIGGGDPPQSVSNATAT